MSYLHCPACSRAYNLATQPSCPYCPAVATPTDPADGIAAAVEALARAMARATPVQRAAAAPALEGLAASAAGPQPGETSASRAPIRNALIPAPLRHAARSRPSLTAFAFAVLDRVAPRAPRLLRAVHARVKALAA
jgi:hypothetical protein